MHISWQDNRFSKFYQHPASSPEKFSLEETAKVRAFHSSFPQYQPTPLRSLSRLAELLGVGGIYVKDESFRFGLNAFKGLGGSYAMGKYLAECLGMDISELPFSRLTGAEVKARLGDITFATTTDGNHGRGVAWTAKMLQQKAVVYMPKGSTEYRLEAIRQEGAEAEIMDWNYDDTVRYTARRAAEEGWVIVQDTAWEGYEEIPLWIMQGYATMADEALEQLKQDHALTAPSHVMIQAGVGSLAGMLQGVLAARYGEERPRLAVVEARSADCLYRSAVANDGRPHAVGGDLNTIMAGLACGEANYMGWELLRDYGEFFFSCSDEVAARGMRVLGNPLRGDAQVISGESGAVPLGLLSLLLERSEWREAKEMMGLTSQSQILLFSTEGDTDPQRYRDVVWDGSYSSGR